MVKTLDKQLAQLPKEVIFCKKCVVSNQRPRTEFDAEGICNACRYVEEKNTKIDWAKREKELIKLLNKHRSQDGSYDVVVPSSGGKDSGIVAHQLKTKYGMHPLTVTWAPFLYTDIGWKNYLNFKDSGFDNVLFYPNGKIYRKLARIAFELKGDAWEPFGWGQKCYPFHIAVRFKIPLIFYGENGEVEYGGSMQNKNKSHESPRDWEKLYYKGSGVDALVKEGLKMGILTKEDLKESNFSIFKSPPFAQIEKLGTEMHWWSYYHKWIPQENYYYSAEHTGFEANPEGRSEGTYSKYASLDDKTDGFHWYLGYIKFGLGRASRDAQMEIRSGHITREEAISLVKRYDGEFPKQYFKEFLQYLGITEKHFWEVIERYRSPHLWKKVNGRWQLKFKVK
ncbi:MAG: LPS biosynthesis protein [Candidatus Yanofskybacteria bacterium RIFCSPHIGHO2_01_FULL_39_8b]|uniref:LPS biosynthesis protein n=1 Tax=Candidatus Yanofskybacteria bacterium RIFCSPHIGHO2_01_FULL_39_8b TaxID=1802659 RepID=A0A1F8EEX6_9BACT|nr:MAG: LPS biosynthesis protein [Candidatus Yanofskybacteria bacterium RIFCSPHIGHO2_01_FULL_39_8b]